MQHLGYLLFFLFCVNGCSKPNAPATMNAPLPRTTSPVPPIGPLILWNGESQPTGVGWVSPISSDMSIGTEDSSTHSGKTAIVIHFGHAGAFLEGGWQWSSWGNVTPVDFRSYDSLSFAIRITGLRLPGDLQLSLVSPGDHHTKQRLGLLRYTPLLTNGSWHNVTIPLKDFYSAGMLFEPAKAIQIILGTWNDSGDFNILIDDIVIK